MNFLSLSNFASLTGAIVSSVIIIKLFLKFTQWYKSSPIRRYVEQTAINRMSEEKLISVYNQLNNSDKKLLQKYKLDEDNKTKIVNNVPEYDNESHIKLKYLGLINELVNNTGSTDKIKSIIFDTIKQQQLQQQIQQLQQLSIITDQQLGQQTAQDAATQLEQISKQKNDKTQQIEQLQLQLNPLQQIQSHLQQQIQAQPQQSQQFQQQIRQITLQQQQFQQQIQQLTQQLNQLQQIQQQLEQTTSNADLRKQQLETQRSQLNTQITQLENQLKQIIETQLTASLVIDVTITKIGNDMLDILNKKVTEPDIKSQLAFHKYYTTQIKEDELIR